MNFLKDLWESLFGNKVESVFQDWVLSLSFKQQTGLMTVIRGTDKHNGNCMESKDITKMLRFIILKDADKKKQFMSGYVVKLNKVIHFLKKEYRTNQHRVEHLTGTAFNINQNHPNNYTMEYWSSIGKIISSYIKTYNRKISEDKIINLKKIKKLQKQHMDYLVVSRNALIQKRYNGNLR